MLLNKLDLLDFQLILANFAQTFAFFAVNFYLFYCKVRQVKDAKKCKGKNNNSLDIFSYLELTLFILFRVCKPFILFNEN